MKILQSIVMFVLGVLFIGGAIFNFTQKANAEDKPVSVLESNSVTVVVETNSPGSCSAPPGCSFYVERSGCSYATGCNCYLMSMNCCKKEEGYCLHYPDNRTWSKHCESTCSEW